MSLLSQSRVIDFAPQLTFEGYCVEEYKNGISTQGTFREKFRNHVVRSVRDPGIHICLNFPCILSEVHRFHLGLVIRLDREHFLCGKSFVVGRR